MKGKDILEYELANSFWCQFIWFGWGQELMARYYAYRVQKKISKYRRYLELKRKRQSKDIPIFLDLEPEPLAS